MKKFFTLFLALVIITSSINLFACGKPKTHTHRWSTSVEYDSEYHYNRCTVENCDAIYYKIAHIYNDGVISEDQTTITYTCLVCPYSKTESYTPDSPDNPDEPNDNPSQPSLPGTGDNELPITPIVPSNPTEPDTPTTPEEPDEPTTPPTVEEDPIELLKNSHLVTKTEWETYFSAESLKNVTLTYLVQKIEYGNLVLEEKKVIEYGEEYMKTTVYDTHNSLAIKTDVKPTDEDDVKNTLYAFSELYEDFENIKDGSATIYFVPETTYQNKEYSLIQVIFSGNKLYSVVFYELTPNGELMTSYTFTKYNSTTVTQD